MKGAIAARNLEKCSQECMGPPLAPNSSSSPFLHQGFLCVSNFSSPPTHYWKRKGKQRYKDAEQSETFNWQIPLNFTPYVNL